MTIPHGYSRQRASGDTVLQSHMEATTQTVRIIEMRRRTIYSTYSSRATSPSPDLALGTLASVASLAQVATHHTAELVAIARNAGASWSQIGDALGISKQAAHKHFRIPPPTAVPHVPRQSPSLH